MLDLALYNPPSPWLISDQVSIPLGILYLAGWVRSKGYSVQLFDLSGGAELRPEDIPDARYHGIGFVTPQFTHAMKILKAVRDVKPEAVVLAGGPHPTALPQDMLEAGFDAVICGEGEYAMLDILENGLSRKIFPTKYIENLDELPFPAWDMIDLEAYLQDIGVVGYMGVCREINIMSSRGCPAKCAYCTMFKGPTRMRSIGNVLSEIDQLRDTYNVERFFFVDDNLLKRDQFLVELCHALRDRGVSWHCLGRADQMTVDKAQLMHRSGCTGIDYGIEHGSQAMLNRVRKGTRVEWQERGMRMAHEAGLKVRAQMIVGLPMESDEEHAENLAFIRKNMPIVTKWGVHVFVPYPSCEIWCKPENFGYELDKSKAFDDYQTIGKRGQSAYATDITRSRQLEILDIIKEKDIAHTE